MSTPYATLDGMETDILRPRIPITHVEVLIAFLSDSSTRSLMDESEKASCDWFINKLGYLVDRHNALAYVSEIRKQAAQVRELEHQSAIDWHQHGTTKLSE